MPPMQGTQSKFTRLIAGLCSAASVGLLKHTCCPSCWANQVASRNTAALQCLLWLRTF